MVARMPTIATAIISSMSVNPAGLALCVCVCARMRCYSSFLSKFDPGQSLGRGVRWKDDLLRARRARHSLVNDVGFAFDGIDDIHAARGVGLDAGCGRIRHHAADVRGGVRERERRKGVVEYAAIGGVGRMGE